MTEPNGGKPDNRKRTLYDYVTYIVAVLFVLFVLYMFGSPYIF